MSPAPPIPPVSPALPAGAGDGSLHRLPPNFGDHHVRPISQEVGFMDKFKHEAGKMSHRWKNLDEKQKTQLRNAATCALIASLIIFLLGFILGAPLAIVAQLAFLPLLGSANELNKGVGSARLQKPYTMPPYSKEIRNIAEPEERERAKRKWANLWRERTQEKVALENIRATLVVKKRKGLDCTQEKMAEQEYLKKYEDAEVAFWRFAKDSKAYDKIEKFNAAREKRGERIKLVY